MIWRWLERHADHAPGRIALRFGAETITYGALAAQVAAMAAGLAARGIGRGDRVAVLGQNHPAQIVALFACARLGAMQVPLNWRLAVPEWRFMLEDSGARLLLAGPAYRDAARAAAPAACEVAEVQDVMEVTAAAAATAPVGGDDDPILLVYTSGTTGRPKAAILDQRAVLFNALNAQHAFALTPDDRILTVLPLFHVGGLNIQTTPALYGGAEVILQERFDPGRFFDAVEAERPTLSLLVPAVMQALVEHPRWPIADLSSLRAVGAGSSIVPVSLIAAFHAKGVPVQQIYGATETSPIAIAQTQAEARVAPGSIGRPAMHVECRVVDPAGTVLSAGEEGEIEVRGPSVLRGYWGHGEALKPGGWFATGDVGRRDADGRWWFTDRRKHVIISGGENIYPAELERLLADSPGVADCAVVGRPDPRWGEVPVAIVVPGAGFDPARVLAHLEGRIARFKLPRAVIPVAALPRTALGKVATGELRALVARGP